MKFLHSKRQPKSKRIFTMKNNLLLFFVLFSLALLGYKVFSMDSKNSANNQNLSSSVSNGELEEDQARMHEQVTDLSLLVDSLGLELRASQKQNRENITQIREMLLAMQKQLQYNELVADEKALADELDALTAEKQAADLEEAKELHSPIRKLNRIFSDQDIDAEWASAQEANITDMFANDSQLAFMPLEKASCKTDICELSIFTQETNQMKLAMTLSQALSKQKWHNTNSSFSFSSDIVDGTMKFYLGKEKDSLLVE